MSALFRNIAWKIQTLNYHKRAWLWLPSIAGGGSVCRKYKSTHCHHENHLKKYDYDWREGDDGRRRRQVLISASIFTVVTAAGLDKTKLEVKDDDNKTQQQARSPHKEQIILLLKHAKLAESKDNIVEAEDYYQRALDYVVQCARDETLPESQILEAKVYVHDAMANLAFNQGQFESAEVMFKETLRGLLHQGYGQTDNAVVEISLKLAMIYVMQQKYDLAEAGYRFCIETQKAKVQTSEAAQETVDEQTHALLGLILDSYARYLLLRNNLQAALIHMNEAIQIAENVFGEIHPQVAVLFNDKATILTSMKQYDEAKKCVLKAIYVAKKTESPDLGSLMCNFGTISIHTGELKMAKEQCQKAQKMAQKASDKELKAEADKCLEAIKRKEQTA